LGGYLFGVLYRDFQWLHVTHRFWPVSAQVTNWQRVDELIEENEQQAT